MSRRDDTLAALDHRWRKPRDIYERIGQWSPIGIRTMLAEMAKAGEIEGTPEPIKNGGFRMLYRRKAA